MRYEAILLAAIAWAPSALVGAQPGPRVDPPDASVGSLPCTPIGVEGPMPWGPSGRQPVSPGPLPAPVLTVVVTDIRPDRARLYLDDRFIGRADDFDGRPDFLYLEPGRYALEARLGGYRSDRFDLVADHGCVVELRHSLQRVRDERIERLRDGPSAPFPLERVFAPVKPDETGDQVAAEPTGSGESADEARTSEVERVPLAGTETGSATTRATLRLRVEPPQASVFIDGEFVATGRELGRLQSGLAVDSGTRTVEVSAAGYRAVRVELDLGGGDIVDRDIRLAPEDQVVDQAPD